MKVHYLTTSIYPTEENKSDKRISHAGNLRSEYILEMLSKCRNVKDIVLVSEASGKSKSIPERFPLKKRDYRMKHIPLGSIGQNKIQKVSSIIIKTIWLLVNVRKQDTIIVYNFGPMTAIPVYISYFLKRFNIIIQFEELYGYFINSNRKLFRLCELEGIGISKGFITPSSEIADVIRTIRHDDPPIIMSYGYFADNNHISDTNVDAQEKLKLTLLYSGTLDVERGIDNLIELMPSVEDIAELIITGTGPLEDHISDMVKKYENIHFLGLLPDHEFKLLFDRIDVCLNPTSQSSIFSLYSFPSKVVYYLSNYKTVLSTMIKPVINSPYSDIIEFYDENRSDSFRENLLSIRERKVSLEDRIKVYNTILSETRDNEQREICKLFIE